MQHCFVLSRISLATSGVRDGHCNRKAQKSMRFRCAKFFIDLQQVQRVWKSEDPSSWKEGRVTQLGLSCASPLTSRTQFVKDSDILLLYWALYCKAFLTMAMTKLQKILMHGSFTGAPCLFICLFSYCLQRGARVCDILHLPMFIFRLSFRLAAAMSKASCRNYNGTNSFWAKSKSERDISSNSRENLSVMRDFLRTFPQICLCNDNFLLVARFRICNWNRLPLKVSICNKFWILSYSYGKPQASIQISGGVFISSPHDLEPLVTPIAYMTHPTVGPSSPPHFPELLAGPLGRNVSRIFVGKDFATDFPRAWFFRAIPHIKIE